MNFKSDRTAPEGQPLPRYGGLSSSHLRVLGLRDSDRLVKWLNGSKGTFSYKRVVLIRQELEDLWSSFVANADAYYHRSGGILRMGEAFGEKKQDWPEKKLVVQQQLHDRHVALNLSLAKYVFRPRATYVISARAWMFGMVPDEKERWFRMRFGPEPMSEADAVLSLLRLAETGALEKLRLCEMCKENWFFAAKRSYRFCAENCRESFYASSPDYHERKANNQRQYRERLKRIQANQRAYSEGFSHGPQKTIP